MWHKRACGNRPVILSGSEGSRRRSAHEPRSFAAAQDDSLPSLKAHEKRKTRRGEGPSNAASLTPLTNMAKLAHLAKLAPSVLSPTRPLAAAPCLRVSWSSRHERQHQP